MKKIYLGVLVSLFVCLGQANAADSKFYVGSGLGITKADVDDEAGSIKLDTDDSNLGFKGFAGYRVNDSIAVEVFYADLGELSASNDNTLTLEGIGAPVKLEETFNSIP